MKTRINIYCIFAMLSGLAFIARADNPCTTAPTTNSVGCSEGTLSPGYLIVPTNISVNIGQAIPQPTISILSITNGFDWYYYSNVCYPNMDDWYTNSINYSFSNLYFVPSLPPVIWTAGTFTYTGLVDVVGSPCGDWTTNLGVINIDVASNHPDVLIDVDFGKVPVSAKSGYAAIGNSTSDFWNEYNRTNQNFGFMTNLLTVGQQVSPVGLLVANLPVYGTNGSPDPMYNGFLSTNGAMATLVLTNLPTGNWNIYLYSTNGNFDLATRDTNNMLIIDYGTQICYDSRPSSGVLWQQGLQYAVFTNVAVTNGQTVVISITPGTSGVAIISGIQVASTFHQPLLSVIVPGMVSWWRGEGNTLDSIGPNNGMPSPGLTYTNGEVGQAFLMNGANTYFDVPASSSLNVGVNGTGLTLEGWIDPTNVNALHPIAEWNNSPEMPPHNGNNGVQFWIGQSSGSHGVLCATFKDTNQNNYVQVSSPTGALVSNQWQHVAVTFDQTSGNIILYVNGVMVADQFWGHLAPETAYDLWVDHRPGDEPGDGTYQTFLSGPLDELSLYNCALSSNEIATIHSSGPAGKMTSVMQDSDYDGVSDVHELADRTDPYNPNSVLQIELGSWSFANATTWAGDQGQLPLTFSNVVSVPSWSTNAVSVASGFPAILCYRDVETNGDANINLRSGTIRFWFDPSWSSVNQGGSGPGVYGRLIEVGNYNPAHTNGWWSLYVSPDGNSLFFGTSTNDGGVTNLTASISWGAGQWHELVLAYSTNTSALYLDGQLAVTGSGILYFPNASERTNGFRIGSDVNGTNQAAGAYADLATFNYPVNANWVGTDFTNFLDLPPTILAQPDNQLVAQGQDATFSVAADSITPMTYQWQCNGTNIPGANDDSFTVYVAQWPDNEGNYSVIISNSFAGVTSSNAFLGVVTPITLVSSPTPQTVVQGTNVSFQMSVSGTHLSWQWSTNGVPLLNGGRISGATSNALTISNVVVSDAGDYSVVVTNLFSSVSASASLTVVTNPFISLISPNMIVTQSDDVNFSVTSPSRLLNKRHFLRTSNFHDSLATFSA